MDSCACVHVYRWYASATSCCFQELLQSEVPHPDNPPPPLLQSNPIPTLWLFPTPAWKAVRVCVCIGGMPQPPAAVFKSCYSQKSCTLTSPPPAPLPYPSNSFQLLCLVPTPAWKAVHVCMCIGGTPQPPAAVFKSLPPRQILTLNFDAPEMWLVEPVIAEHDLDNLKLEQLGDAPTLSAEYELEALMLTGRCMDLHARRRELVRSLKFIAGWLAY